MNENKPSPLDNPNGLTQEYIDECYHPAIQRLKPQLSPSEQVWMPTLEQLLSLLRQKCNNPNDPLLRPCEDGWECVVTLSEWTADYGTFVEARRRFVGNDPHLVVLHALKAAIGAGERWMVGGQN